MGDLNLESKINENKRSFIDTLIDRVKITLNFYSYPLKEVGKFLNGIAGIQFLEDPSNQYFNCFAYAFKIQFVEKTLITELQESANFRYDLRPGDYIWYFFGQDPVHIGFVQEDSKIISKWGQGPVLKHPIWSVPLGYGLRVKYSTVPSESEFSELQEKIKKWKDHKIISKFFTPSDFKEAFKH